MAKIRNVYKFKNNALMVFDEKGDQMGQFQGEFTPELMRAIFDNSDENTTFDGFGVAGALDYRELVGYGHEGC